MTPKTLTAVALIVGMTSANAMAAPAKGGINARERVATRALNQQQLAAAAPTAPVGSAPYEAPATAPKPMAPATAAPLMDAPAPAETPDTPPAPPQR